ncbi:MAG: HypC/HybG/HupF family hydrogenase formation chaperone [Bilifractor sp.]
MCVAMPGKVIRVDKKKKEAVVDFSGNQVKARSGFVSISPGDYVLVHAGCILQKLSSSYIDELRELNALLDEQE